jgi:hypothetical protein
MPALLVMLYRIGSGLSNLKRVMRKIMLGHTWLVKHGVSDFVFGL